jgi:LemA protein
MVLITNTMLLYILILVIIGLLLLIFILYFNKFIRFRNKVKNAWSDIDVQLKRRYNLIPALLETVKGYASYERSVLEEVTKTRSLPQQTANPGEQAKAENQLTGALKGLFAVVENYPDLLANQNFKKLQDSLIEVEENLQMARRYYNAVVRDNNTSVESFPGLIIAKMSGFKTCEFFEIEPLEREVIKVQ